MKKIIIAILTTFLIISSVFAQKADKRLSVTLVRWAYT